MFCNPPPSFWQARQTLSYYLLLSSISFWWLKVLLVGPERILYLQLVSSEGLTLYKQMDCLDHHNCLAFPQFLLPFLQAYISNHPPLLPNGYFNLSNHSIHWAYQCSSSKIHVNYENQYFSQFATQIFFTLVQEFKILVFLCFPYVPESTSPEPGLLLTSNQCYSLKAFPFPPWSTIGHMLYYGLLAIYSIHYAFSYIWLQDHSFRYLYLTKRFEVDWAHFIALESVPSANLFANSTLTYQFRNYAIIGAVNWATLIALLCQTSRCRFKTCCSNSPFRIYLTSMPLSDTSFPILQQVTALFAHRVWSLMPMKARDLMRQVKNARFSSN